MIYLETNFHSLPKEGHEARWSFTNIYHEGQQTETILDSQSGLTLGEAINAALNSWMYNFSSIFIDLYDKDWKNIASINIHLIDDAKTLKWLARYRDKKQCCFNFEKWENEIGYKLKETTHKGQG